MSEEIQVEKVRERGGCLTAFLGFMFLANLLLLISMLYLFSVFRSPTRGLDWVGLLIIIPSAVNIISIIALWKWKLWGFWLYLFLNGMTIVVGLGAGANFGTVVGVVINVLILWLLLKPKWELFE